LGFVERVALTVLLEREPLDPASDRVAVLLNAVTPFGAPLDATSMSNVTVAVAPAASEPMFFVRVPPLTGSGLIVTLLSLALPATYVKYAATGSVSVTVTAEAVPGPPLTT
jgi:hypothetical protein